MDQHEPASRVLRITRPLFLSPLALPCDMMDLFASARVQSQLTDLERIASAHDQASRLQG